MYEKIEKSDISYTTYHNSPKLTQNQAGKKDAKPTANQGAILDELPLRVQQWEMMFGKATCSREGWLDYRLHNIGTPWSCIGLDEIQSRQHCAAMRRWIFCLHPASDTCGQALRMHVPVSMYHPNNTPTCGWMNRFLYVYIYLLHGLIILIIIILTYFSYIYISFKSYIYIYISFFCVTIFIAINVFIWNNVTCCSSLASRIPDFRGESARKKAQWFAFNGRGTTTGCIPQFLLHQLCDLFYLRFSRIKAMLVAMSPHQPSRSL